MKITRRQLKKVILKELKAGNLGRQLNFKIYDKVDDRKGKDVGGGDPPIRIPRGGGGGGEEPCFDETSEKFENSFQIVLDTCQSIFPDSDDIYRFLEENGVRINYDYEGPGAGDMLRNMIMGLARDYCIGPFKQDENGRYGIDRNELVSILVNANRLISYINPEFLL
jgi:hypothetical protein